MAGWLQGLGSADFQVKTADLCDYFIQRLGLHAQYLYLKAQDYVQFIIDFDRESAEDALAACKQLVHDKDFCLSEWHRIEDCMVGGFAKAYQ